MADVVGRGTYKKAVSERDTELEELEKQLHAEKQER